MLPSPRKTNSSLCSLYSRLYSGVSYAVSESFSRESSRS